MTADVTNHRYPPTGVMWHRTWLPSIPTQLNVECGKLLLRTDLRYASPSRSIGQTTHMLFLHGFNQVAVSSVHLTHMDPHPATDDVALTTTASA